MNIKNIIVPYDFSDCATDALRVAAKIAGKTGAIINVVHVYEQFADFTTRNQGIRDELNAKMDQVPELDFLQGLELRKFMLRQMAITEIFKNEHLHDADLIIMGSHGASGLRGIVGSNTQKIVRISPMPVLVIKHRIEDFSVQDVVYASNFSDADITKFTKFKPLFDVFNPKIHLVKINTPKSFERTEESTKNLDAFLQKTELQNYSASIYNDLTIEEGILNFSRSIDTDMIAMATHGRTGFFHVVNGSLTEDIVNHTTFPVLSIKL